MQATSETDNQTQNDPRAAAGQRDAAQAATVLAAIQEQLTQQHAALETLRHDLETAHTERAHAREDAAGAREEVTPPP